MRHSTVIEAVRPHAAGCACDPCLAEILSDASLEQILDVDVPVFLEGWHVDADEEIARLASRRKTIAAPRPAATSRPTLSMRPAMRFALGEWFEDSGRAPLDADEVATEIVERGKPFEVGGGAPVAPRRRPLPR